MSRPRIEALVWEFAQELSALLKEATGETEPEAPEVGAEEEEEGEGKLSVRTRAELIYHEGIVLEAYKDSKNIWTWGIGVTDASGHRVLRYKDNPQTLKRVFEIFEWLVRTRYLPDVLRAFKGHTLSEAQLAAALSFHYNTGAINKASWVRSFKAGKIAQARSEFMQWRRPPEIIPRRRAERDLFFDGKWSSDGTATLYRRVRRPSYQPDWGSAQRVDIRGDLA